MHPCKALPLLLEQSCTLNTLLLAIAGFLPVGDKNTLTYQEAKLEGAIR
jgi:hypothetical protein